MSDFTSYSTVAPFISSPPSWVVDPLEQQRVTSYAVYEQMYWNVPQTFKLSQRGSDTSPIYVPAARTIVETLHRFLATGFNVTVDPLFGTPQGQELAMQVITDLMRRERLRSRFTAAKRFGIIRGDWLWHIYADPNKAPGSKISVHTVDPASWFPIYDETNLDNTIGVHIVEEFVNDAGDSKIRRLTYRKEPSAILGAPPTITMEDAIFAVDDWGGPGMDQEPTPEQTIVPLTPLPAPIDSLPLYAIQNFQEPNNPYGSSELRGFERILAAVNQGISDEELALAMDGLGVYTTDAGEPIDETGTPMGWNIGPAQVVEVPAGHKFARVQGIGSVTPMQDHLKYLHDQLNEASGSPAVARGVVDVQVAESGVALLLEMGPILARASEREDVIKDVFTNLLYDLPKWYVAYEGSAFNSLMETRWVPTFADPLPINVDKLATRLSAMVTAGLLSKQTARELLRAAGEAIPEETEEQTRILAEAADKAAVEADAYASRLGGELAEAPDAPPEPTEADQGAEGA